MDSRFLHYLTAMAPRLPLGRWDDLISTRAAIHIDYRSPGHELSPLTFGHFIEELGRCIEDGLWSNDARDPDYFLGGIRPEVLEAVRSVRPACIRWPGGCFADSYRWRDGVGPMEERRALPNRVWGRLGRRIGPEVSNQFGTREFLLLCEEVGAEPMITANVGTAEPREAADWVEYCNGGTDSRWGAQRARDGRERPFGAAYWFVGNEMWNPFEPGWCSAGDYARRFLEHAREMRSRDPGLRLIAVGLAQESNAWNREVLRVAGEEIDYLSIHAYYPHLFLTFGPGRLLQRHGYYWVLAGIYFFERLLDRAWEAVEEHSPPSRDIKLAFDEWNLWYNFTDIVRANYNLRDGLFCASVLNRLLERSRRVPIANIAQLVNCIGIIFVDPKGAFLTPSAWVFKMYAEGTEELYLEASTECDRIAAGRTELPALSVCASRDIVGERLVVAAVNHHRDETVTAAVRVAGFHPRREAEIALLHHHDPMRYNTLEEPFAVAPHKGTTLLDISSEGEESTFTHSLPPHSVSVLSLQREQP